jgi:hypothetical protein
MRTMTELKSEKLGKNNNVSDVWSQGKGHTEDQIQFYFRQ